MPFTRSLVPFVLALCALLLPATASAAFAPTAVPQPPEQEQGVHGTVATAMPISTPIRIRGEIQPTEVDVYSFTATAGERVHAATMTAFSAQGSASKLVLFGTDGTTVLESDLTDGSQTGAASVIAGAVVPTTGTYYVAVSAATTTARLLPYDLHVHLASAGTPEAEPNDTEAEAAALPEGGTVAGALSSTADVDAYALPLSPGDTVALSLDLDPERDATTWNGQLNLAFGATPLLVANDTNATSPNAEAMFFTADRAGTYTVSVRAAAGAGAGTYALSARVTPARSLSCTSYTGTGGDIPDRGAVQSTIDVTDDMAIGHMALQIHATHGFVSDLDVVLRGPDGQVLVPLTDVGPNGPGVMDVVLDDDAAATATAGIAARNMVVTPEGTGPLDLLSGSEAAGTWTLEVLDDALQDAGTLDSWGLTLCPREEANSSDPAVFETDFESGADGFTHSGTQDEWELGTPTALPNAGCYSGSSCWDTDLDGAYDASSSQDLVSPPISLAGRSGPIRLEWAQALHMETDAWDNFRVTVRQVGNPANARTVYRWRGPTMNATVGSPVVTVQQFTGWTTQSQDISDFAGTDVEVVFHLDSDTSVHLNGATVDDVAVRVDRRELTVAAAGTGTGHVTSSPAGIDCGIGGGHGDCTSTYDDQTSVVLTPHVAANTTFVGFTGGGCSGTTCTVTLDQARTVTATFALKPKRALTIVPSGTGTGHVTSSPAGIDCGIGGGGHAACSSLLDDQQVVVLTAHPAADTDFVAFSGGGCTGATCAVTMDQARTVTATFVVKPVVVPPGNGGSGPSTPGDGGGTGGTGATGGGSSTPPPPPGAAATPPDTLAPTLVVAKAATSASAMLGRIALKLGVTVGENARVTSTLVAKVRVPGRAGAKPKLVSFTLAKAGPVALLAGQRTLSLRPTAAQARLLKVRLSATGAKLVALTVTTTATDASGNTRKQVTAVKIKR